MDLGRVRLEICRCLSKCIPRSLYLGLERDKDRDWDRDRDWTFRCGPSRRSDLPLWSLPQDRTFRCGPSRGDWTFQCGPSRGIGLSDVAPPAGLNPMVWPSPMTATPRDCSNILWEHAVAFKGTVYEKCVYSRTILPKAYNIHALDLLYVAWRKRSIPRDGPHRGINNKFEYLGEFEFIFETALWWGSVGGGTCFYFKNQRQNSSWHCPFNCLYVCINARKWWTWWFLLTIL